MSDAESALDEVVEAVRAALHARRAKITARVQRVADALRTYERALESELARSFAEEHGLARPVPFTLGSQRAFELLDAAVRELPEAAARPPRPAPVSVPPPEPSPAPAAQWASAFPLLTEALARAKLVIIGALSGRDRSSSIPLEPAAHVEWIDTERDGAHAIGNLPQRVRQGRVAGVVILERVVQHRHTDPVVAAAREARVPVAFAGQGGKASLVRALERIEAELVQRNPG
ncbi:MAG TPA: hypothetical protein VKY73_20255 [Polyangiaceae bacterium]|nr:hypothetical protein [Polyangiaceae bacterium]